MKDNKNEKIEINESAENTEPSKNNQDSKLIGFNEIDIDKYINENSDELNKDVLNSENNGELREVVEYSENDHHNKDREDYTIEKAAVKTGSRVKNFYKFIDRKCDKPRNFLYRRFKHILDHPVISSVVMSFIMLLFIETMSRSGVFTEALKFMVKSPLRFALNWLIVLVPFMVVIAVEKKLLFYVISIVLWAAVGITDYHLLQNRTTPFVGTDIDFSPDELAIAVMYMGKWKMTLIIIGVILALLVIFGLVFVSPKTKTLFGRVKSLVALAGFYALTYIMLIIGIHVGVLTDYFGNLAISYHDYGIAYCLSMTIFNTGISEPADYSPESVKEAMDKKSSKNPVTTVEPTKNPDKPDSTEAPKEDFPVSDKKPNIIFIQLESYIDPTTLGNIECSMDPTPYFKELKEKYSSGYVTVPTIVTGTCNTEFETITGMSLEFFGPGEYPYKTKVNKEVCESMAFDIKKIGYAAHAIHNNKATFYGRNEVFANLGFDTFTSIETMGETVKTPNGWAKDDVLIQSMIDCMESTESKDLIYTVSVQCHGTYNVDSDSYDHLINVTGIEDETLSNAYNYYVNQVYHEDDFLRRLTTALANYDEDVVLVMYGDHIPGLSLTDDDWKDPDRTIYQTEFVIWDNMGLEKHDLKNIYSYQLAAYVFDMFDIHEGTLFKYHQDNYQDTDGTYLSKLKLLMYDMLYGEKYVYNEEMPFEKTDIEFGVKDVIIRNVTHDKGDEEDSEPEPNADDPDGDFNQPDDTPEPDDEEEEVEPYIYIEGENFNPYSKLFIDGTKYKTSYISSTLLRVKYEDDLEDGTELVVKQMNSAGDALRESEPFIYENK